MATLESYNSATWVTDDVTITKPTGLAEGDLMVAVLGGQDGLPAEQTGWTTQESVSNGTSFIKVLTKIATSGDAAASDFTFVENAGATSVCGVLYRITGNASSFYAGDIAGTSGATTVVTGAGSVTPSNESVLILSMAQENFTQPSDFSSYTVSGSNPSWTEAATLNTTLADDAAFGSAYASLTTSRELTSFSVTSDKSATNNTGVLVCINSLFDVTANADVVNMTATALAPTVTGDANVAIGASVDMTLTSPAVTVTVTTVSWTNDSLPTETVWVIENQ